MTKLRHFDNDGAARFVTVNCHRQLKLLQRPELIRILLRELDSIRKRHKVKILAYVIMPEHVHLVLLPTSSIELGRIIGEWKSRSARAMLPLIPDDVKQKLLTIRRNGETRTVFWQPRCYDHNCRSPESVREKIEYCHKNPVRRGLAAGIEDWPWSSYRWFLGDKKCELYIDAVEL